MHGLSAAEMVEVWERGQNRSQVERALLLLAAACPETPWEALTRLDIGERDARLLTLREWAFGPRLTGLAVCPKCGESLELELDTPELLGQAAEVRAAPASERGAPRAPEGQGLDLALSVGDYELRFRLPDSVDLGAAQSQGEVDAARGLLVERCLLSARQGGGEIRAGELPPNVVEAMAAAMAQADPQADLQLALACPQCREEWQLPFDIVAFFWSEINAWVHRVLREVHALASAYGWREADILALTPTRRQLYLEMIGG